MRTLAISMIIALLPFAAAEVLIEAMLRFPSVIPSGLIAPLRNYYYQENQPAVQFLPDCGRYDPELFYTLKPGECRFAGPEFDTVMRINSLGVRDDEASLRAPKIIVAGDSVAMGWGAQEGQSFPDILEHALSIRVLNLSISSYGTARQLKLLRRADTSALEFLVVQYSQNDLDENLAFLRNNGKLPTGSQPYYEEVRDKHLDSTKYYFGKHVLWAVRELTSRYPRNFVSLPRAYAGSPPPDGNRHRAAFLRVLDHFSSENPTLYDNLRIIVVAGDELGGQLILPTSGKRLIRVPFPATAAAYLRLDAHLSAVGHEEIAGSLLNIIRNDGTTNIGTVVSARPDLNRGLVGHWTFDGRDLGPTIRDRSGRGNHGISNHGGLGTRKAPGKIGEALEFAGGIHRVTIAHHDSIDIAANEDFTIAMWVRSATRPSSDEWPTLLAKTSYAPRSGYNIYLHESTNAGWMGGIWVDDAWFGTSGASRVDIADDTWHHIAFVRYGTSLYSYTDGELTDAAAPGSSGSTANSENLSIGPNDNRCCYFTGALDDVRIYNRALSQTEVKQLYSLTSAAQAWTIE